MADDYSGVRIIMDLPRLGELVGAIAERLCEVRDIEPPDFDGEEMREVAIHAWRHCLHMADRAEFASSVQNDLAMLDELSKPASLPAPMSGDGKGLELALPAGRDRPEDDLTTDAEHRPEFGFFEPPV